ncbi:MAG: hypothetical protein IKL46_04765 [Clostridia bacterium]|nr:hypothetical protein [Clostridia bacterium]
MDKDIVVALVAAGSSFLVGLMTLIGVIITNSKSNKSIENKLVVAQAVTDTKIDELKSQVEKHNKVIERVYKLEKSDEVEQEKIKVINHRIDDLEKYHK